MFACRASIWRVAACGIVQAYSIRHVIMSDDLVPYIPKRWRDASMVGDMLSFAAIAIAARVAFGPDPVAVYVTSIVGVVTILLLTTWSSNALVAERVTRNERRRRLDVEGSSAWEIILVFGGGWAIWTGLSESFDVPPRDFWDLLRHLPIALAGGAIMGSFYVLVIGRSDKKLTDPGNRAQAPRRRRSKFEAFVQSFFVWALSVGLSLTASTFFADRWIAGLALTIGFIAGTLAAVVILQVAAPAGSGEIVPSEPRELRLGLLIAIPAFLGVWFGTLIALLACVADPAISVYLLLEKFATHVAMFAALGVLAWVLYRAGDWTPGRR